jgi:hypothetical protein
MLAMPRASDNLPEICHGKEISRADEFQVQAEGVSPIGGRLDEARG